MNQSLSDECKRHQDEASQNLLAQLAEPCNVVFLCRTFNHCSIARFLSCADDARHVDASLDCKHDRRKRHQQRTQGHLSKVKVEADEVHSASTVRRYGGADDWIYAAKREQCASNVTDRTHPAQQCVERSIVRRRKAFPQEGDHIIEVVVNSNRGDNSKECGSKRCCWGDSDSLAQVVRGKFCYRQSKHTWDCPNTKDHND
mmetsp:Transcript_48413/g.104932  ORF Transcript_48413/g.104932 Transcript_48413/m.104932 type:complete len:201 (+) Transcript_48413:477-1079(+)